MLKPEELLREEKLSLLSLFKGKKLSFSIDSNVVSEKNAEVSVRSRKEGNALYKFLEIQNFKIDQESLIKIWDLYTLSIIFAPNNSEELALGYGNKSALFLRISSFESCIKACDQALNITLCNYLKLKLLYRKAKSLYMLNKSPKGVCKVALLLLENLTLDEHIKDDYKRNLIKLCRSSISASDRCKSCNKKHHSFDAIDLLNFERSQEVPCASKSVAIQYNKKWGRHIIATEDIEPGEIIAIENFCLNFPCGQSKYQFCGNCMNYLLMFNVIPCEYCINIVYCSESCRKEAWEKYHQFDCNVLMLLNLNKLLQDNILYPLRILLLGVYQVGSLEKMKEQLLEIENTKDARTKGFSNGIFKEEKVKSFLSLSFCQGYFNNALKLEMLKNSCLIVFLLAKYTNFFGRKMNLIESQMFLNKDILFTAALFLRCCYIYSTNSVSAVRGLETFGFHMRVFGNLFNHSCDPNVSFTITKSSQDIYFARYPIKKDSQLFLAYNRNTFLNKTKECRQKDLISICNLTCECTACKENWSNICLPSLKVVLEITPLLRTSMLVDIVKIDLKKIKSSGVAAVSLKREQILLYLRLLSKNFTVYCQEYLTFLSHLENMYCAVEFS